MRKYLIVLRNELVNLLEYRADFISSFLFSLVPFGVNTLLWIAVAKQNESFSMGINEVVSYYLIVLVTTNLTESRTVNNVSKDIRLGDLNKYLVKPCSYILYQLMIDLPRRLVFIVMNFIPIALLAIILRNYFDFYFSGVRIFYYLCFIGAGYVINFFIDLMIGFYSFYFTKVNAFYSSIRVFRNIMSGSIFPLNLLSSSWFSFLSLMPFAYSVFFPSSIFLNTLDDDNLAMYLVISIVWCIGLFLICLFLWDRGLKRYSSFGG
ncbi:ABC transporter permease [Parasphaerochaeta coccoides]|uniref:ABC-2 type transporter n=1 Tax=Parasphaerochaeta coccoides (strain ATCC BAA-1237 / DSM 17374 / SPN1) TaxID=760011 RepID=F4GIS9_PARC1|nr:ABC-2 family transporter protein [Parasphaerochaeta coccoides]AEC02697.1 protein of unknown function DUF990 [Parasphaerochaeta coccoides DSM 17374]